MSLQTIVQQTSEETQKTYIRPKMCLEYHYSWSSGHGEQIGVFACGGDLRATLELHSNPQALHIASYVSLGYPGYPCPRCYSIDISEALVRYVKQLPARLESIPHQNQLGCQQALESRAERLRQRQDRMLGRADAQPSASNVAGNFVDILDRTAHRNEQAEHLFVGLSRTSHQTNRGPSISSTTLSDTQSQPSRLAFVPGTASWAPDRQTQLAWSRYNATISPAPPV